MVSTFPSRLLFTPRPDSKPQYTGKMYAAVHFPFQFDGRNWAFILYCDIVPAFQLFHQFFKARALQIEITILPGQHTVCISVVDDR